MLNELREMEGNVDIVYNIAEVLPGLYLPNAYIVSRDKLGNLAHIKQKATSETVVSFKLFVNESQNRLFQIINDLLPDKLEKKYSPPKKKIKSLEVLMADEAVAPKIIQFVQRRMDELLTIIVKNNFFLTWAIDRRVLVKDFIVKPDTTYLQPHLTFHRDDLGVSYQLRLSNNGIIWRIKDKDVTPILNSPGWLLVDYVLYRVSQINGNMVKPFLQKNEIRIPKNSVKSYFQKFIIKIAAQLDFEATGFTVLQSGKLTGCRLDLVDHLFGEGKVLQVKMIYEQTEFSWYDKKDKKAGLSFQGEEVTITQITRDATAEKEFIDLLHLAGLQVIEASGVFTHKESEDKSDIFAMLQWLSEHKISLEKQGFIIGDIAESGMPLSLDIPTLTLDTKQTGDWFDIDGAVTVGKYSFSFRLLAPYIRKNERLYPLPDGTVFVIPLEWMNKFKDITQFAKTDEQSLRINKNQYTLLQEADISLPETSLTKTIEINLPRFLKAELRPYQLTGYKWLAELYHNNLGACLADDMGLGKTLQTIAVLLYAKERKIEEGKEFEKNNVGRQLDIFAAKDAGFLQSLHTLVILPASLVFNWEKELARFAPNLFVYKHTGNKRHKDIRLLKRYDVILTTYQTVIRDATLLSQMTYEYIILDESQQIKNKDSAAFININELEANHKISLSGTPIENSLSDLWSQMQFINPDLLGNFNFFKKEFILPIERIGDEEKKAKLRSLVSPFLLRRTKEEVAKDLPPLTTQVFYSEMSAEQKKLYEKEKSAARNYLLENFNENDARFRMELLQTLTKLRQLVNHPVLVYDDYTKESGKFQDICAKWEEVKKSGHKVLFFSSFVKHLSIFKDYFEETNTPYAWLTGSLTAEERQKQIMLFENNPTVQAFFISIKAGGTGLNLTAADYVFILDPWWNPSTEQQAIARAHRIGQEKSVMALKFITRESIEEKILHLQEKKSQLAEDILSGTGTHQLNRNELNFLLS
jgi:non-specific serine/threonine protein kinase